MWLAQPHSFTLLPLLEDIIWIGVERSHVWDGRDGVVWWDDVLRVDLRVVSGIHFKVPFKYIYAILMSTCGWKMFL